MYVLAGFFLQRNMAKDTDFNMAIHVDYIQALLAVYLLMTLHEAALFHR